MPSSGCQKCARSEEHTSELQSHDNLVCRLLLEKNTHATRPPRTILPAPRPPPPAIARTAGRGVCVRLWRLTAPLGCGGWVWQFLFFFKVTGPPENLPRSPPGRPPE